MFVRNLFAFATCVFALQTSALAQGLVEVYEAPVDEPAEEQAVTPTITGVKPNLIINPHPYSTNQWFFLRVHGTDFRPDARVAIPNLPSTTYFVSENELHVELTDFSAMGSRPLYSHAVSWGTMDVLTHFNEGTNWSGRARFAIVGAGVEQAEVWGNGFSSNDRFPIYQPFSSTLTGPEAYQFSMRAADDSRLGIEGSTTPHMSYIKLARFSELDPYEPAPTTPLAYPVGGYLKVTPVGGPDYSASFYFPRPGNRPATLVYLKNNGDGTSAWEPVKDESGNTPVATNSPFSSNTGVFNVNFGPTTAPMAGAGTFAVATTAPLAPDITHLEPDFVQMPVGEVPQSYEITIRGNNFEPNAEVWFGSYELAPTYISDTELRVTLQSYQATTRHLTASEVEWGTLWIGQGDNWDPITLFVGGHYVEQSKWVSQWEGHTELALRPLNEDRLGMIVPMPEQAIWLGGTRHTMSPTIDLPESVGGYVELTSGGTNVFEAPSTATFYLPDAAVTGYQLVGNPLQNRPASGATLMFYNELDGWTPVLNEAGQPVAPVRDPAFPNADVFHVTFSEFTKPGIIQLNCFFAVMVPPAPELAPAPLITSLAQTEIVTTTDMPPYGFGIHGERFTPGSVALWNGQDLPTTFISDTNLYVELFGPGSPAAPMDFAMVDIQVRNEEGTVSAPAQLLVRNETVRDLETVSAGAGTAVSVSIESNGTDSGIATRLHNTDGEEVFVSVATYSGDPTPSNPDSPALEIAGSFLDLQVRGADSDDFLVVLFYYPGADTALEPRYFANGQWHAVQSSVNYPIVKNEQDGPGYGGYYELMLDNTSSPKITELTGTVFALVKTDVTAPVIVAQDLHIAASMERLVSTPTYSVQVRDDVDANPLVTYSVSNGAGFAVGTTVVTVTATDASGNSSQATFKVIRDSITFQGFDNPLRGANETGGSASEPLRAFRRGSAIPLRFSANINGAPVVSGTHTIALRSATTGETVTPNSVRGPAAGNAFTFTGNAWAFDLDTRDPRLERGVWQVVVTLADGSVNTAWLELK